MIPQTQTPHRPVEFVSAGEYRKLASYKIWRPSGTDDWLLILTVAGKGMASSGGREVEVGPRSVVLFRPGTPQEYRTDTGVKDPNWHLLFAHLKPASDYLPWLAWPEVAEGFYHVPDLPAATYATVAEALREANTSLARGTPVDEALAKNAAERALLHIGAHCDERASTVDPRIQRAVRFVSSHLERSLSLREMAEAAGMSVSHFCHVFPRQMKKSPQAFLEELRMRRGALRLRMEDAPISEIAYELGYNCPYYFTNRFRKRHGMSPTAYRAKSQKERRSVK